MPITIDQTRWVASLSRLELTDAELAAMTDQLSAILDYVDQLKQVPTDDIEPLAHPLDLHNIFRPDSPVASLTVAEALANAPAQADGFFEVPAVLD
jgi:aspartyl-tRNA(Asn)/glutamyl-tRNA(Gln) amidotransferase subunit C